jgi:hypothetical protein
MPETKTAVEWLAKELTSLSWDYLTGSVDNKTYNLKHTEILNQAKEMEKQQIKDAFYDGKNLYNNWEDGSNQYYNETYGKNN